MKDNLLVFLTPHVVRNKTDLRALALDQRARFTHSLGPREMRDMPGELDPCVLRSNVLGLGAARRGFEPRKQ